MGRRRREEVEKKRKLGIPFLGRVPAAKVTDSPLACLSLNPLCLLSFCQHSFPSFSYSIWKEMQNKGGKKGLDDVKMTRFSCLPPREFGSSAEEGWSNRRIATSFSIFQACLMTGRRADSSYYTAIPPCLRIRECLV